ncbi:MAG: acyl-CoA dehydrogenase family protein, partial [Xanthobacteraceae bacterium]
MVRDHQKSGRDSRVICCSPTRAVMNFELSEEQNQFAAQVRRFAREHLAAGALKRAHDPRFPFDVAQLMARHGLMGITLPQGDGGQGGSLMDAV